MDKNKLWMVVAGASVALILIVLIVLWRVSASNAKNKAADLVSATADMARCVGGDDVKLERAHVLQSFERRMVSDLPDIITVRPCGLALDVVKEKWETYERVWFNSTGAKGEDGVSFGDKLQKAYDEFRQLPLDKSSDQVFLREKKYGNVLEAGNLAFEMYEAARNMYLRDGASEKDLDKAKENRLRKAPRVTDRVDRGRTVAEFDGKVKPVNWKVYPSGKGLVLYATNDRGDTLVAWSGDGGASWKSVKGPTGFGGKTDLDFRVFDVPGDERWFLLAHGKGENTETLLGKVTEAPTLPAPTKLPAPPEEWKRAPEGEREAVVLAGGVKAFPVWRIIEKTEEEKKAEKEEREDWEENFADKEVQALLTLSEQRRLARAALGIDDDHKRLDGIAYVVEGGETTVRELPGFGLAGLVPGAPPIALLGEGSLPAQKLAVIDIPAPGEPLGMMGTAASLKPVEPALRSSPWYQCISSDGTRWGTTTTGNFMIGMRSGGLDLVHMTALADEGSHVGCGPNVATVALPFQKDRIYANLITIRGGEIEGGKIHTTAGTDLVTYNETASTSAAEGAVVLGWIARGYGLYTVNIKTDNDFMAPKLLAEAGTDGSKISGLHFVGMGQKMYGFVTRERCEGETCKTTFEVLVSEDGARTWTVPG